MSSESDQSKTRLDGSRVSANRASASRSNISGAPPRALLLGRQFWPHGSTDSAAYLIQLATGLQRHGVHVEVLTPRYANVWPAQIRFREIKVHRPAAVAHSDWSVRRYVRQMTAWTQENGKSFDVLLSNSAREEAAIAVDAAHAAGCSSIVRLAGHGVHSDVNWWTTSRAARRCAGSVQRAHHVIVSNALQQRQLISQGFAGTRIKRIDSGFNGTFVRSEANRIGARRALAAMNTDLHAPPDEPVAVCVAPMERGEADALLDSAMYLVNRFPTLRLWIIGDGSHRDSIYHRLRGDGVRANIAMPGSFADLQDVFAAADLFVQTSDTGLEHHLPAAIEAELPIVIYDAPRTRAQLALGDREEHAAELDELVHWYNPVKPKTLRRAIRMVLDDREASRSHAATLRRTLVRNRPYSQTIDAYVQLIQQAAAQNRTSSQGGSFGAVS